MIIPLPDTTTGAINKALVQARKDGGVVALGRVMTLVIDATGADLESAIETANYASRSNPCRIIVLADAVKEHDALDAEIRVGGDAGASEVIVLRPSGEMVLNADTLVIPLLLPDAPIVAWWVCTIPENAAATGIGSMAARRITDSKVSKDDAQQTLDTLAFHYVPGDTDLAWTRLTRWRALLAAALEQVTDRNVTLVRIHGDTGSPSILLLAAWLRNALKCDVEATYADDVAGIQSIELETAAGLIALSRPDGYHATFSQPDQPDHIIALPPSTLNDCLTEELRRLDADDLYAEVLAVASRVPLS